MSEAATLVAKSLGIAIETTLSPLAAQSDRHAAYNFIEEFKEKSHLCSEVGVLLARTAGLSALRSFGLQLLEHCVRFRWNCMALEEKIYIKESAIVLMSVGTLPILEEAQYVKEGLARLVIEIAKREWPQQWQGFLNEVTESCLTPGFEAKAEIGLIVLLRLSEDIGILQNVENPKRRKDLYQQFTASLPEMFAFIDAIFVSRCVDSNGNENDPVGTKIIQAALRALSSIFEWCSLPLLIEDANGFFPKLFLLMQQKPFRMLAADCIIAIVNRNDHFDQGMALTKLFDKELLQCLYLVASSSSASGSLIEDEYLFEKKCAEILLGLGNTLSVVWVKNPDFKLPDCTELYFKMLVSLIDSDSLIIREGTVARFLPFLRTEKMRSSQYVTGVLPELIQTLIRKMPKFGYPYRNDHPACKISAMDFDSDKDFSKFHQRFTSCAIEILRVATSFRPDLTFQEVKKLSVYVIERISENLTSSVDPRSELHAHVLSAGRVIDAVCEELNRKGHLPQFQSEGYETLKQFAVLQPRDLVLYDQVLSCVSGLLHFAGSSVSDASDILRYLLFVIDSNAFHMKEYSKERTQIRRHSIALLGKCGRVLSQVMQPLLDDLLAYTDKAYRSEGLLSNTDKSMIKEVVLIVINDIPDIETQKKYLQEVLKPVPEQWNNLPLNSPAEFLQFYGISLEAYRKELHDPLRQELTRFLALLRYSVSRVRPKADGKCALTPCIIPLLPNLFRLIKGMLQLYAEASSAPPELAKVFDLSPNEQLGSLCAGITDSSEAHQTISATLKHSDYVLEGARSFLTRVLSTTCETLGHTGNCMLDEFYSIPGLAPAVLHAVLEYFEFIPLYRQKIVVRVAICGLVENCPVSHYEDLAVPLIGGIFSKVTDQLNTSWEANAAKAEAAVGDEEADKDVLIDAVTWELTKELLELLKVVDNGSINERKTTGEPPNQEEVDDSAMSGETRQGAPSGDMKNTSELLKAIMSSDGPAQHFILFQMRGLTWPHTASHRCAVGLVKILEVLQLQCPEGNIGTDLTTSLMISALRGIEVNGQHDHCLDSLMILILRLYGWCRKACPSLLEILRQIPHPDPKVDQFDQIFEEENLPAQKTEKKKKDALKAIIVPIIGKHSGQLHKREVHMKTLPSLGLARKRAPPTQVLETNDDVGLIGLFGGN